MSFPVARCATRCACTRRWSIRWVKKLYAVAGASGGSVQAVEWSVLYPDFVDRAIPVISPGLSISPWAVALLDLWVAPIKADPKWNNGDYYGKGEPVDGIALALKAVTITTRHWTWVEKAFGYKTRRRRQTPAADINNRFASEDALTKGRYRPRGDDDANNKIYMAKATSCSTSKTKRRRSRPNSCSSRPRPISFSRPRCREKAAAKLRGLGKVSRSGRHRCRGRPSDGVLAIAQASELFGVLAK